MNNLRRTVTRSQGNVRLQLSLNARAAPLTARSAAFLRLPYEAQSSSIHNFSNSSIVSSFPPLRSQFHPEALEAGIWRASSPRSFHHGATLAAESKEAQKETEKAEHPAESSDKKPDTEQEGPSGEEKTKDENAEGEEGGGKKGGKKSKEPPPPPPPHGDKSPWQVFTETLKTEFQQSKEWNESTKQLGAGVQSFTENENVRRAREAYSATTGAVSSTTGRVLKTTAGAVGKGAAWTWDTPVMKGVRSGVSATADVLDKSTKPLRETEAYKNVKNVIDDGSSSKYGGWIEKEERRKRRELREAQENPGSAGKPREVPVEDPK